MCDRGDEKLATVLNTRAESLSLLHIAPNSPTSRRSSRIIHYAFAKGTPIAVQTCNDNTNSDHRPVLCTIQQESNENSQGTNTHWKVFNYFLSLTAEFWEKESAHASTEPYYTNFVSLLSSLKTRCTTRFPLNRYRAPISMELRQKLSDVRALSFQHKRTSDTTLHEKIKILRRQNRDELYALRATTLEQTLEKHNIPEGSTQF